MPSAIEQAIRQICEEKGLAYEAVVEAIQAALAAAYRKDFGDKNQNIEVEFDVQTGESNVFDIKTVVEDIDPAELERLEEERKTRAETYSTRLEEARVKGEDVNAVMMDEDTGPRFNPKTDLMLSDARVLKRGSEIGDVLRIELPQPGAFGRMAAMTAKQVITQKLREAEREVVFNEFKEHEGQILVGTVQRQDGRLVLIDLGRTTGALRPEDQLPGERYRTGDRIKVYVSQVALTTKGPQINLTRVSEGFVRKMFEMEIPEVAENTVDVKAVAREAGSRSKVAVWTGDDQIDPIGACIGQRGTRIQTIIAELGGEKVDIIQWSDDPVTFIGHALSPAKVNRVELNKDEHSAVVHVNPDQLSLAIGKGGQNVRLAANLTGWKINIAEVEGHKKEEAAAEFAAAQVAAAGGEVAVPVETVVVAAEPASVVDETPVTPEVAPVTETPAE